MVHGVDDNEIHVCRIFSPTGTTVILGTLGPATNPRGSGTNNNNIWSATISQLLRSISASQRLRINKKEQALQSTAMDKKLLQDVP